MANSLILNGPLAGWSVHMPGYKEICFKRLETNAALLKTAYTRHSDLDPNELVVVLEQEEAGWRFTRTTTFENFQRGTPAPLTPTGAKWAAYLMGFAQHAATNSKDSTQVGAALVADDRTVLLTGYNGPPAGVDDLPERRARPTKYFFASHAEQNLIAFAARRGIRTEGCTVYVTHKPCSGCAKSLIQAGISAVVYGPGKTSIPVEDERAAQAMFDEAGVTLTPWPENPA